MTDDEMMSMPIPALQDEGLLFLWVTGRAMEVGRECMRVWGWVNLALGRVNRGLTFHRYTRVDEVVWVKINQVRGPGTSDVEVYISLASANDTDWSNRSLAKVWSTTLVFSVLFLPVPNLQPYKRTHARRD